MKASEWLATLPSGPGPARERVILDAVRSELHIPPTWCPITSEARGHRATFYVSADALMIGEPGDSVRVSTTATTAQTIADMLGASLYTAKLHVLAWEQADSRIEPILNPGGIAPGDRRMADTDVMVAYSRALDDAMAGKTVLIRETGKAWIVHNRILMQPHQAVNFGFISPKAPNLAWDGYTRLWQPVGSKHLDSHVDYSQVLNLVHNEAIVDGERRRIVDIMVNAELSWLLNDDGVLRVTRYPVPVEESLADTERPPPEEKESPA